jgi:hypothetical protein
MAISACRQQMHAFQAGQRQIVRRSQGTDLLLQRRGLLKHQLQALGQTTNRRHPLLEEDGCAGAAIRRHGTDPGHTGQTREMAAVIRIDLEQQVMDLIAEPRGLRKHRLSLRDQEVEHGGLILGRDMRQGRRFLTHELGDGVSIQPVAPARLARTPSALGGPAGIDLRDCFALRPRNCASPRPYCHAPSMPHWRGVHGRTGEPKIRRKD